MARYRRGRQNYFLHAAIVAVAAATTSLWLGRAQAGSFEHLSPNLDGIESVAARVHRAVPSRNRTSFDWLVVYDAPPSIAVSSPDVTASPAPTPADPSAGGTSDSGASSSGDSGSDASQSP
jgi:hypothetical protein